MINDREILFASSSAGSIISKELADDLYRITKNAKLNSLLGREKIILSASLREQIKTEYNLEMEKRANYQANRKGVGGRKRLPEPEYPESLQGEDLVRYKNRVWQRESRARRRAAQAHNG